MGGGDYRILLPAAYTGGRKREIVTAAETTVDRVVPNGGQLRRFLIIASVDPRLWAEKRTNEGKLVDVEARQLDGLLYSNAEASG